MEEHLTEDRVLGMILGAAVGDALGSPVEFMSREQIEIKHGVVRDMIGGGWLGLRPGQWTDDTAMALCLLESLLQKGDFDPGDVASRYVAWFRTRPLSVGNTVRAALSLLEQGTASVTEAAKRAHEGAGGDSADNDTVMRAWPLAARFAGNPQRLMETSFLDARITHWDLRAASGSAYLNLVLSALLRGAKKSEAFAWAEEAIEENEYGLYTLVPDVTYLTEAELKPRDRVEDTLTCAFWYFRHGAAFEEIVVRAVNRGGEAGTVGTIVGALSGARYGACAVPPRWARVLQDRGKILSMAKQLARSAAPRP